MPLTVKRVEAAIRKGAPAKLRDSDGLNLIIDSKTAAYWLRRYQLHHRQREMGLARPAG